MIAHVVLMTIRPDLSDDDRRSFARSFERAMKDIPSVRAVRIGRRRLHGAGYESAVQQPVEYLAVIDFDDVDGLQAYLHHPAHEELGMRFATSLSAVQVYDFDAGGVGRISEWL